MFNRIIHETSTMVLKSNCGTAFWWNSTNYYFKVEAATHRCFFKKLFCKVQAHSQEFFRAEDFSQKKDTLRGISTRAHERNGQQGKKSFISKIL